jgi:hypothetical protein
MSNVGDCWREGTSLVRERERSRKDEIGQEALFGATVNGCGSIVFTLAWTV